MWTRRELKDKSKFHLKMNYWKCVLAALLLSVLGGGAVAAGRSYDEISDIYKFNNYDDYVVYDEYDDSYEDDYGELDYAENGGGYEELDDYEESDEYDGSPEVGFLEKTFSDAKITMAFLFVVFVMVIAIFAAVLALTIPLEAFLINPLEVGIRRFFVQNLREPSSIREICYSFDHSYLNCVKIMFFRDLYTFLWGLLFIIPGIIKLYEYRMIPYLLAEYQDISKEEAFAQSRIMMTGNKWKAFVLDLSFLGWYILNGLTFGILGIFYVNPYKNQTNAALYQKLKSLPMMNGKTADIM